MVKTKEWRSSIHVVTKPPLYVLTSLRENSYLGSKNHTSSWLERGSPRPHPCVSCSLLSHWLFATPSHLCPGLSAGTSLKPNHGLKFLLMTVVQGFHGNIGQEGVLVTIAWGFISMCNAPDTAPHRHTTREGYEVEARLHLLSKEDMIISKDQALFRSAVAFFRSDDFS